MSDLTRDSVRFGEARGRWVLAAAVLGSAIAFLDATVVNVALPAIGEDLDADFAGLQWTVNGYTLTLAAFLLLGGSLGDRFGRRRVFLVGIVWFGLASLLCGLAPDVELLVAARVLQGVGGALLTPGSLALISSTFDERDRARAIGAWSALGGLAGIAGPLVGGLLIEISWRLVFLLNPPLCAAVVWMSLRHVPESVDPQAARTLDVPGALVGAIGLGALTYGLVGLGEAGASGPVVLSLAAGVLALVAFVVVEGRTRAPMLPLEVFRSRQFSAANLVTFAVYAALGGVFFLLVVHLQVSSGYSPLAAGLSQLPVVVAMLLLSPRFGALSERHGPRRFMAAGPLLCGVGAVLLLRVGQGASYLLDVLPAVAVLGVGLGVVVAPLTATVLAAAEQRHAGVASGVNNAVARTASLLAVAVLPVVAGLTGADYTDAGTFTDGFRTGMVVCAALLVLGGVLAWATISDGDVRARPWPAARRDRAPRRRATGVSGPARTGPGSRR
ncbi:MAG TPA: MFS transporter [Mycobacteriales bacterium]|nr:MFS transporter [Mycobacteriales bacterium]